jgi:hypothetical protein
MVSVRKRLYSSAFLLTVISIVFPAVPAQAATTLFPNLKTLPPRDLRFDTTDVDPEPATVTHNVLRFSNTVWNAGSGPLELRGQINPTSKSGAAIQRVYSDSGSFTDFSTGNTFYWHAAHQHYHFDNWGTYELWTRAAFEAWLASGRTQGTPMVGSKTTSCVEDEEFVRTLPNQPYPPPYTGDGCFPDASGLMLQGLSPGWGDTYDYYRADQWIDLGANGHLADGEYVLRSVVDPLNKVYESAGKSDAANESPEVNEATTKFSIQGGKLVDTSAPTGTVRINDIDAGTASPKVTVKVLGRDDISGVTQVKLSNNGTTWSAPQTYTGAESTAQAIPWDLTDATYGGTGADGLKTVYAQFKDATGRWSASESDTIELSRLGGVSAYSNAVLADGPAGFWRLGETSGSSAKDQTGAHDGTYTNGPTLGQASLLAGDTASKAVLFDGVNDHVRIPTSESLSPPTRITAEAWIKPTSLPGAGAFASILTKPESYSLQFNGPRLEFTIIQAGVRKRLQAPSGAIAAGSTYHVVGTYDGTTQRLYVNGAQVASTPLAGGITVNNNALYLGSWGGTDEFFKGTLDEAAVYPSVLSAARVTSHYQAGIGESAGSTVNAPTNLTATAPSSSQVNLSWTDNATNEGEFVIERDTSSQFPSPVKQTAWANSTTFSDLGLAASTTYYYRVRAKNATDSSTASNTASATTLAVQPPPTGYSAAVVADSPVSYWRLGETSGTAAADERGANPGTYTNSPTLGAASLLATDTTNKAVGLDGVNDTVKVASSATLGFTTSVSLEAWIKPTSLPSAGAFASILTKPESYSLQFNGPRLEFTIIQAGVRKRLQAPSGAIVAGSTYHVVGTYDGTTQRLYVNGAQVASTPLAGAITVNSNPLYLGSWGGTEEFFKGTLDDAAVYGSTLSAARVSAHYQGGSGTSPPPPPPPPTGYSAAVVADSPVSYWRLGEASGTAAADERGANPGTYANSPTLGAASLLATDTTNKAVGLDGVNDTVKVASSATLGFTTSVSLEAWIKPTSLPSAGAFASILTKPESYSLQFNGPRLEFTIIQAGVRKRLQAPSGAIVAGSTYHVVGTYDGTTQRLYVNGAQVASTPLSGAVTVNSNPLYLGSWGGTEEFFKGTLDDAAVYGSTLSAARVSAHYQGGTSTQTAALLAPSSSSRTLVAADAYSIAAEPTFIDYCQLGRVAEAYRAYEPWRQAPPKVAGAAGRTSRQT